MNVCHDFLFFGAPGSPFVCQNKSIKGYAIRLFWEINSARYAVSQKSFIPLQPQKRSAAPVAELADAPDLGSGILRCAGSIPVRRTKAKARSEVLRLGFFCAVGVRWDFLRWLIPVPFIRSGSICLPLPSSLWSCLPCPCAVGGRGTA